MRRSWIVMALLIAATLPLGAQGMEDSTRCFRFDRAYFGYPPARTPIVTLTARRHPEPRLGPAGYVIELPTLRPDSAERERRQLYSGWAPLYRDSVIVVWRNAFAGHRMRLLVRGDSLVGVDRFLTDDRQRAAARPSRVRAVRVACPSV